MNKVIVLLFFLPTMVYAKLSIDVDIVVRTSKGETNVQQRSLIVAEGEPYEFSCGDLHCKMIACQSDNKKIKADFQISEHGVLLSSPCVIASEGEKAKIELREKDTSNFFELSLVATSIES